MPLAEPGREPDSSRVTTTILVLVHHSHERGGDHIREIESARPAGPRSCKDAAACLSGARR